MVHVNACQWQSVLDTETNKKDLKTAALQIQDNKRTWVKQPYTFLDIAKYKWKQIKSLFQNWQN